MHLTSGDSKRLRISGTMPLILIAGLSAILLSCSAAAPRQSTGDGRPPISTSDVPVVTPLDGEESSALSPESVLLAEAEGYHSVAAAAQARGDYAEAEYNFEKALELLASLDPVTEFTDEQSS